MRYVPAIWLALAALLAGARDEEAAWGDPQDGLQCRVEVPGKPAMLGAFPIRVSLRNSGAAPLAVGPAAGVFGWVFIAQGDSAAWYGDRLPLARDDEGWPETFAPGQTVTFAAVDVGPRPAYPFGRALRVANGYPKGPTEALAAGGLAARLRPESARLRFMLYLPQTARGARLLVSNTVTIDVAGPDLNAMSEVARDTYIAELMARFRASAWAAKQAHAIAVSIGPSIGPALLVTAREPDLSPESRMWLATALADIRYEPAAPLLTDLVKNRPGLRAVIAYHGPKLGNPELNAAIEAAARDSGVDVTVWAFRGLVSFGDGPTPELRDWALHHDEPRLRAAAAMAFARTGEAGLDPLVKLLGDSDPRVVAAAAHGVAEIGKPTSRALAALFLALDRDVPELRVAVVKALCTLTGRDVPYDPGAEPATRAAVIADWREWLVDHTRDYR